MNRYCAEKTALKLLMKWGKKEALLWMKQWLNIIDWIGEFDRIKYWEHVYKTIETFKYEPTN